MSSTKDLVRKSWDATSNRDMGEFLGWVMASLRMRGQRVSPADSAKKPSRTRYLFFRHWSESRVQATPLIQKGWFSLTIGCLTAVGKFGGVYTCGFLCYDKRNLEMKARPAVVSAPPPRPGPPAHQTRFLKTWVWAMPERAQQLGLMVYRVVDDVTWVEVARDLPEIIPRGLPGYRRYF